MKMKNDMALASGLIRMLAAGTLAAALVGSCGGGGSDKPLTVTDYCSRRVAAECDAVKDRCLVTSDACRAARMTECLSEAAAAMQNASRPFQAGRIGACANKATEVYSKSTITPADRKGLADVCGRVFSGAKVAGAACMETLECNEGLICDETLQVCAQPKTVSADAFCGNPGELCPAGQYCAAGAAARQCMDRKMASAACGGTNGPCIESLRCVAGTCGNRAVLRESCTSDDDCVATGADAAPYCDRSVGNVCTTGFIPSPSTPECRLFGAAAAGGGTGGASGAGGAGGAGG